MTDPVIYHGTPLTPRAALHEICKGRAMCVSFYRPDDVDAVEAISPAVMYDNGAFSFWKQAMRSGQEWAEDRDWVPFLSVVGVAPVSSGAVGSHPRHAGRTEPAQRQSFAAMAIRTEGRAALAHGRADRTTLEALREIRPSLLGMDGYREGYRLSSLSRTHGRGFARARECLAGSSHDARDSRSPRLPLFERRQHVAGAERVAL